MPEQQPLKVFRQFPVQLKLAGYLRRKSIAYNRLAICAIALRVPIPSADRAKLIDLVRAEPFRPTLSPYSLSRIKGRSTCDDPALCSAVLLGMALELLGSSYSEFLSGAIRYPRLSFLVWLLGVTDDRALIQSVAIGLRQEFFCQINEYALSQGIQGHKQLSGNAKLLIVEAAATLTGDPIEFSDLF